MHRALEIVDIVELICSFFHVTRLRDCADLSALAQTCLWFLNPALDVLWRHQWTLSHLFGYLPEHMWEEDLRPFRLRRPIEPADWDRARFYASRIRKLDLEQHDPFSMQIMETFTPSFLDAIPDLLLNLETIVWGVSNSSFVSCLRYFLRPRLKDMTLQFGADTDPTALSLLPSIAPNVPCLQRAIIRWNSQTDPTHYFRFIGTFLRSAEQLERLRLDDMDEAILLRISHLPRLQALEFTARHDAQYWNPTVFPRGIAFPALRRVIIHRASPSSALALTSIFSHAENISHFSLGFCASPSADLVSRIISLIAETYNPSTLEHLNLGTLENDSLAETASLPAGATGPADFILPSDKLRPLYTFKNLTLFYLSLRNGVPIDDADAVAMAHAWPHLQHVNLWSYCDIDFTISGGLTLRGLCAFARYCRELKLLAATLDADEVPTDDEGAELIASPQECLWYLGAGTGRISEAGKVAGFLARVFTSITHVEGPRPLAQYDNQNYESMRGKWAQVQKMVQERAGKA
ncbi:hypothetical protein C8F01DRAFT_369586 [Mycena amicta]|nr:hypothetical protein C8F01DRAFT_369586 [Mycena amicta]